MAHNIYKSKVAYAGEKPWHGIGTELDRPATAAEAIAAAGLNYRVAKVELQTTNGIMLNRHVATVNMEDSTVLGVVGPDYQVLQNKDAFGFFDSVVGEGQAVYHVAGALGKGERIWILAKLPEPLVIAREDIVEKYLLLTNSHDGTSAMRMYFTPVRVVCQNTLIASQKDARDGIAIRHSGNMDAKVDEARRLLGISVHFYNAFEEQAQAMVSRQMNNNDLSLYYKSLLFTDPKKADSKVLKARMNDFKALFENGAGNNIPGVKGTLWAAYNSVTEYTDWQRTVRGADEDPTNKLRSIWLGAGAALKQRALAEALAIVR